MAFKKAVVRACRMPLPLGDVADAAGMTKQGVIALLKRVGER